MKNIVIIQARLNSKRLPNKILKKIGNYSCLDFLLKRLKKSKLVDKVIIASNKKSKSLKKKISEPNLNFFFGSDENVLKRYYDCCKKYNIKNEDNIIRITADCPFLDPKLLDKLLEIRTIKNLEVITNTQPATYPDGMDISIFKFYLLKKAYLKAKKKSDLEHVTPFIYRIKNIKKENFNDKQNLSNVRITLDDSNDLEFLNFIFKELKQNIHFNYKNLKKLIFKLRKNNPKYKKNLFSDERNLGKQMSSGYKIWKYAETLIPSGNMLLSKRPDYFIPYKWPTYYSRAKGCNVWDLDGKKYVDFSAMGIGTSLLGYSNDKINKEAMLAIKNGVASTLNSYEDVRLAEYFLKFNKWAHMVKFTRSGGEALAVAVRLARAYSGKDKVLICGYHGWHDWYLSTNLKKKNSLNNFLIPDMEVKGVPNHLKGSTNIFEFNDLKDFKKKFKNKNIGAVIMEVERNDKPKKKFLSEIRKLTSEQKIPLIFDECTSGFRETRSGIFEKYGVFPDIAMFGKSIANGHAFSLIAGKKEIMNLSKKTFISSTMWSERVGPAAALAALKEMDRIKSWKIISRTGNYIKDSWIKIAKKNNLKLKVYGIASVPKFEIISKNFNFYKTFITSEMLKKNILATNYIFVSISHTKIKVNRYLKYLDAIFKRISEMEKQKNNFNLQVQAKFFKK